MHRPQGSQRGTHTKISFWKIYPLSVILTLHLFLVAYINSSYMEQFVSTEGVSALFTIGSAIGVLAFLFFSHALKAIGNLKLTLILAVIETLSLLILGFTEHRPTAIIAFVVFLVTSPLLYLNIDIFSETLIGKQENTTGQKRGVVLGIISTASVVGTLAMGVILNIVYDLSFVYYTSAGLLVLFIVFLFFNFGNFKDPKYDTFEVHTSLRSMWLTPDIRNVMFSHFLLQIFFAWTVIYFPLYMYSELGMTWDTIGYVTAFALLAYALFEWPTGIIADRWLGEKELMAIGFLVLAITASWMSFMTTIAILPWMVLLFMTRVGAALVEATTEIYFFKHTNGDDADTISFFRLLRPLSAVAGALLGSICLLYLPFNLIFVVLGFAMVPGIFFTYNLHDTK